VCVSVFEGTTLSEVRAAVTDPSGVEDSCDIAEDSAGVYQVLFRPRHTGLHFVAVHKNNSPVPGMTTRVIMPPRLRGGGWKSAICPSVCYTIRDAILTCARKPT